VVKGGIETSVNETIPTLVNGMRRRFFRVTFFAALNLLLNVRELQRSMGQRFFQRVGRPIPISVVVVFAIYNSRQGESIIAFVVSTAGSFWWQGTT
jgi:hypothetical protein